MDDIPENLPPTTDSKKKRLLIGGGILVGLVILAVVIWLIWRSKNPPLIPRSIYLTPGMVLPTVDLTAIKETVLSSKLSTPAQPEAIPLEPTILLNESTAPPLVEPRQTTVVEQPILPDGWSLAPCPAAGVLVGLPPDFVLSGTEMEDYLILVDEERGWMVDVTCGPAEHGGTLESELQYFLQFQENVDWGMPIYDQSGIGLFAASEGPNTYGNPIAGIVVGPTRNNHVLTFWAQAPIEDWLKAKEVFMTVARLVQYVQGR